MIRVTTDTVGLLNQRRRGVRGLLLVFFARVVLGQLDEFPDTRVPPAFVTNRRRLLGGPFPQRNEPFPV